METIIKRSTSRKRIVLLACILAIVVISIIFGYKFVLYKYNLSKSINASDAKLKITYCEKAIGYKNTAYAQQLLVDTIKEAANHDIFSIETIALGAKEYLEPAKFNALIVDIYQLKAEVLLKAEPNKAVDSLLKAQKYGLDLSVSPLYKKCLFKLAGSFLQIDNEDIVNEIYQKQFDIGDLDNDGIYEIVILGDYNSYSDGMGLGYDNENSSLVKLYKFLDPDTKDAGYKLVVMGNNEEMADGYGQLIIAKASKDVNGIFFSTYAGAHAGNTGLLIYKNNKLNNIDIGGFSLYPSGVKDIDSDGIYDVGVLEPIEGSEGLSSADTPLIEKWYKWDGNLGGTIVKTIYPN